MRSLTLASPLALAVLALPATAAAQDPAPAAPAPAKLALDVQKAGPTGTVLAGTRVRVKGTLSPYVAGQKVTVRFLRGDRKLRSRTVTVQPTSTKQSGSFTLGYVTTGVGRVVVAASHRATPEQATAVAKAVGVSVLPTKVGPGSSSAAVRALQARLDRVGYVVGSPGAYDARTSRAVHAFRKTMRMKRTYEANRAVLAALAAGKGAFRVRFPNHGRHLEADISRQVLALIGANGKVERIYPTSTGAPSTPTIRGSFKVYRKDLGTNALGMVHSSYFIRGYAIHGYKDVPAFNASHGCLRVPVPDALSIFRWMRFGTIVDTYA